MVSGEPVEVGDHGIALSGSCSSSPLRKASCSSGVSCARLTADVTIGPAGFPPPVGVEVSAGFEMTTIGESGLMLRLL